MSLSLLRVSRISRIILVVGLAALALAMPVRAAQEVEAPHPAHIHSGTCAQLGDVVAPLTDVAPGVDVVIAARSIRDFGHRVAEWIQEHAINDQRSDKCGLFPEFAPLALRQECVYRLEMVCPIVTGDTQELNAQERAGDVRRVIVPGVLNGVGRGVAPKDEVHGTIDAAVAARSNQVSDNLVVADVIAHGIVEVLMQRIATLN